MEIIVFHFKRDMPLGKRLRDAPSKCSEAGGWQTVVTLHTRFRLLHPPGGWVGGWVGGGGGYSVRKLLGVCRGVCHWKLDPKRSRGKWYFGTKKIEFYEDLYPKDRFCVGGWEKTPHKGSSLVPRGSKKGVKTAAHMYHPSYREYHTPTHPPTHPGITPSKTNFLARSAAFLRTGL